ncbi:V-set domain-containing T-cell activation inhibitor 1-like [Puntigrus tetrazona]|uniref:V-set domain-containing T-cell activation inhibitor 1-like n=1 Tax=Puntigrus tetrazona TaxID=1606681 RepID=UPI001C8A4120|nr:V-set domain-containing T-cell activation inhibitor 1-like [Puntigrus tetrazona]
MKKNYTEVLRSRIVYHVPDCVFVISVCLQVTVEAAVGGSVILPCSLTAEDIKLQDIDVHWRQNDSKIVHDIIKGEDSVAIQDPVFKKRVETFPDEYVRGNFSIKLNNLQHTDAGKFICYITPSSVSQTVELIINGSRSKGGADIEGKPLLWVYIVIPVSIAFISSLIIFCWRKKKCFFCFKLNG